MNIDRLSLRLTGMTAESGADLGRRIANKLAGAQTESRDIGALSQTVTSVPGETPDQLADRIVAGILRSVARSAY